MARGVCAMHVERFKTHGNYDTVIISNLIEVQPGHQMCRVCRQELPESEFHGDASRPSGFSTRCKACQAERGREWAKENRDKSYAYGHNNRVLRKELADGTVTPEVVARIRDSACVACGSRDRVNLDHIIPIIQGGANTITNVQPLCNRCNSSKGGLTMDEWKASNRPRALMVFGKQAA